MSKGYGVMCPECDNPLEPEEAEMVIQGTSMVVPIHVFFCVKCSKHFRWKSRVCPQCQNILVESKREMKEPLYWEMGLYCDKCTYFWNDKKNLIKTKVEEVMENVTKHF